jgi:putative nucleotidyltransferase with HDIG domain
METEFSDPACGHHKPNTLGPVVIRAFAQLSAAAALCQPALPQPTLHVEEWLPGKKAQRDLAEGLSAALAAVGSAIEADDESTASHQGRVATIASAIAGEMGWDEDHIHAVQVASTLHDVGKVIVSEKVLTKPGRLTEEEFAQVKLHPEPGYAILRDIPFPWPIAETVRQHHERMDGSGYPRGLKGDEILPMARVLRLPMCLMR